MKQIFIIKYYYNYSFSNLVRKCEKLRHDLHAADIYVILSKYKIEKHLCCESSLLCLNTLLHLMIRIIFLNASPFH